MSPYRKMDAPPDVPGPTWVERAEAWRDALVDWWDHHPGVRDCAAILGILTSVVAVAFAIVFVGEEYFPTEHYLRTWDGREMRALVRSLTKPCRETP